MCLDIRNGQKIAGVFGSDAPIPILVSVLSLTISVRIGNTANVRYQPILFMTSFAFHHGGYSESTKINYRIPGIFRGMYISQLSMKPGFLRLKFRG